MARRESVTVAAICGTDRPTNRAFLAQLDALTAAGDNVVMLRRGQSLELANWRVRNPAGLRRTDAAALARTHGIVVFVDERVETSTPFLDALVLAFADPGVAAVAPRSNVADGDELLIGVPYRPGESGLRRSAARQRFAAAAGETSDARVLSGPCLAIRAELLAELGGLEGVVAAGFDFAGISRTAASRGRLVVAEGAYLHHPGGERFVLDPTTSGLPFISACLIVKDEEANLERCLASLDGLADEIVVYDTGSIDQTRELAAAAGATVIKGYWDDDFARARNAALDACRGQWILWIDADEALVAADPAALRAQLLELSADVEGYLVLIDNLRGTTAATVLTHPACRLFRRAYGRWEGGLHEQVVARAGRSDLALVIAENIRITHWGYIQSALSGRDKANRNLRTAFGDLAGGSELEPAARLLSLARSYLMAGRLEEGLELARLAVERAEQPATERLGLRALVEGLLAAGQPEEALVEVARLRAATERPILADAHEGHALLALERPAEALAMFERVGSGIDDDGFEYTSQFVAAERAQALAELGRDGEAADVLLCSLSEAGGLDAHLGLLVDSLERAGRDLGELRFAIAPDRAMAFVPQLVQLRPEVADRALEAWHLSDPTARPVLAAVATIAHRLPISRQLIWSQRLRAAGVPLACPLVRTTTDPASEPRDRVLAAAAATVAFGDVRARQAFGAAALAVGRAERDSVGAEVTAISGELGAAFAALLPATPARRPHPPATARPRSVLVIARQVSALRSLAVAATLADLGHQVTLLQPQPALPSELLLATRTSERAVAVHGWHETDDSWADAALGLLARLYAEQRFDAVVLAPDALELATRVSELLPVAELVVDGADGEPPKPLPARTALVLAAPGAATPDPVRGVPAVEFVAPVVRLFGHFAPVPAAFRRGVVVVANLRGVDRARASELVTQLVTAVAMLPPEIAVTVVGDDPHGEIVAAVPAATVAGPLADPTPYLRAARVVVALGRGVEGVLALSWACGTPAFTAPEADGDGHRIADAIAGLTGSDSLFAAFAPTALPEETLSGSDPLAALAAPYRRELHRPEGRTRVRLVGAIDSLESLAQVNRELAVRLARPEQPFSFSVVAPSGTAAADATTALRGVEITRRGAPLGGVDLEIRHQWPPDFSPPARGRLVIVQPWEFGGLPAEWVGPLRDVADDLWVPTNWVRACAIESGIDPERVHVVPNGVDVTRYRPDGPAYPLRTRRRTRLLFVGGLIERKGIDALLEAYLSTFRPADDVCLVIKTFGSNSVYANSTLEPAVRRAALGDGPEIEIVDGDLSFAQMAALYRSCHALVHPYRGEGFGLPIAEAMASGLPVVVPDAGACRDFCDDDVAYLVAARRVAITPSEWTPTAAGSWWFEPSRQSLAEAMHAVVADPSFAREKGAAARRRIVERFTWDHAADVAATRINELLGLAAVRPQRQREQVA